MRMWMRVRLQCVRPLACRLSRNSEGRLCCCLALLIRALLMSGEGILPCKTSSRAKRNKPTNPAILPKRFCGRFHSSRGDKKGLAGCKKPRLHGKPSGGPTPSCRPSCAEAVHADDARQCTEMPGNHLLVIVHCWLTSRNGCSLACA